MKTLNKALLAFWLEESGITAVEYAIAAGVIAVGTGAMFTNIGTAVLGRITALNTAL